MAGNGTFSAYDPKDVSGGGTWAIARYDAASGQVSPVYGELQNCLQSGDLVGLIPLPVMRDVLVLVIHLIATVVQLGRPGGLRSVVAESVLVRHQLQMLNRGRKRAPNLHTTDRLIYGVCTLLIRPSRLLRSAIVVKPATLLRLHQILKKRRYRCLFSPQRRQRPGPKGPEKELIDAVVEMKRRNPGWGCPRIAQQIALAFGVNIDKDVVRRILSAHYRPESVKGGVKVSHLGGAGGDHFLA